MTTRTGFFIAPANDPADPYAAGYDGNVFATREEAQAEIPLLAEVMDSDPAYWTVSAYPDNMTKTYTLTSVKHSEALTGTLCVGTSRPVRLHRRRGACTEILSIDRVPAPRCGAPATEVYCDPGAGRREVRECYCDRHGGESLSEALVLRDWSVVAPDSVGGDYEVQEAGCASLDSRHVYVVVRPENGRWVAARGIGGLTEQVRRPDADPERVRKASREHRRRTSGARRGGGASWPTAEEAEAAAVAAWRAGVAAQVAEITAARGGTLAWGMPVEPRSEPIILRPVRGQSAYAANRVRRLAEHLGPPGLSVWTQPAYDVELLQGGGSRSTISADRIEHVPCSEWAVPAGRLCVLHTDIVYLVLPDGSSRNLSPVPVEQIVDACGYG